MSRITYYNRLGDPVELEDTKENRKAMESAGFDKKRPKHSFSIQNSNPVEELELGIDSSGETE